MKKLNGRDFGYPLLDLAEAYVYRKAFTVGWERHASWEFHHVLSGTIDYEFDGGRTFELHGGMFLAIPPRTRHRTRNGAATPSMRLALRWQPEALSRRRGILPLFLSQKDLTAVFTVFARDGLRARVMSSAMVRSAKEFFRAIELTDDPSHGLEAVLLRHRANDMLINLALAGIQPEPISKEEDVVAGVAAYIDAHLGERLKLQDLARISGYGTTQLTKLFEKKTGLTPNGYVVRARIARASQLLTETDLTLTEIAQRCGFSSGAYFSFVFRKYCNRPPSTIRSQPADSPRGLGNLKMRRDRRASPTNG